jgi:hypothetical protein
MKFPLAFSLPTYYDSRSGRVRVIHRTRFFLPTRFTPWAGKLGPCYVCYVIRPPVYFQFQFHCLDDTNSFATWPKFHKMKISFPTPKRTTCTVGIFPRGQNFGSVLFNPEKVVNLGLPNPKISNLGSRYILGPRPLRILLARTY